MTFLDFLRRHALLCPDDPAVEMAGQRVASFKELFASTIINRDELSNMGLRQGSIIALHLSSPGDFVAAVLAIASGAICAPLPLEMTFDEALGSLSRLKAEALVNDGDPEILRAARELKLRSISVTTNAEAPPGTLNFGTNKVRRSTQWVRPLPGHTALMLQTTGSTGNPKSVPVSHQAIISVCLGTTKSLELTALDRCLNFMGLNHVAGLISGFFLPLIAGCTSFQAGSYTRSTFFTALEQFEPTWFSTAPAIYRNIIKEPEELARHLLKKSLRFIRCGSSSLPISLARKLEAIFGLPLIDCYGMSEALQVTCNPIGNRRLGSVGRSVSPTIEIRDEENRPCPSFTTGAIFLSGPSVIDGHPDGFDTGDRGWLDDQAYLYIVGRRQEVINRGGESISPSEVEQVLLGHPSITDAIVFSLPHDRLGQEVASAVVPVKDGDYSERLVKEHLINRLSPWKHPRTIIATSELPRSKNGKVLRKRMAEYFSEQLLAKRSICGELPATAVETFVAQSFAEILKLKDLRRNDNFFELGGSSIDVLELVSTIGKKLGETVYVLSLIKHPVLKDFARFLQDEYGSALKKSLKLNFSETETASEKESFITVKDISQFQESLSQFNYSNRCSKKIKTSPFFILSSPRAGSTLLRLILAGHPGLFAPPEIRLLQYPTMSHWKRELSGPYTFYQDGLVRAVMSAFGLDAPTARTWCDNRAQADLAINSVYNEIAEAIPNQLIVDETPEYSLDPKILEQMEAQFDEPRYLHLTRNPIDAIKSFTEIRMDLLWMYGGMYSRHELAELLWWTCNENSRSFLSKIPAKRKFQLNFEDLVRSPVQSAMSICKFLGLPFYESMLNVYDGHASRMNDDMVEGAYLVEDLSYIDPQVARSGMSLSEDLLSEPVHNLAQEFGYTTINHSESRAELVTWNQLSLLMSTWSGQRHNSQSLIVGKNITGQKPPIFWCMQGAYALEQLALALGPDQPVYGTRSGHLLFRKEDEIVEAIACLYADDLLRMRPQNPLILGGNCQGGYMAFALAAELTKRGISPGLLCLLEADIRRNSAWDVCHFFGEHSHHNPLKVENDARQRWGEHYKSFTVDLLAANHGHFFDDETVGELAAKLSQRIESWRH